MNLWAGEFGNAYLARNRVNWRARMPLWKRVLDVTKPRSVLEVGCNAGWNLMALRALDRNLSLVGIDVNDAALVEANEAGLDAEHVEARDAACLGTFDLVLTAGLLIHIPPSDLPAVMGAIAAASSRWVVAVEYASEVEEEVNYRGMAGALWRRPFGAMYEALGLALVETIPADKTEGFDDCQLWVLRK